MSSRSWRGEAPIDSEDRLTGEHDRRREDKEVRGGEVGTRRQSDGVLVGGRCVAHGQRCVAGLPEGPKDHVICLCLIPRGVVSGKRRELCGRTEERAKRE
jgi:hypothetical protein